MRTDESSYLDYDEASADAAEADALRDRLVTDYMAAREAVRRIHHRMSREEVWAIKSRFYAAERELNSRRESDAYHEMNERAVAATRAQQDRRAQ